MNFPPGVNVPPAAHSPRDSMGLVSTPLFVPFRDLSLNLVRGALQTSPCVRGVSFVCWIELHGSSPPCFFLRLFLTSYLRPPPGPFLCEKVDEQLFLDDIRRPRDQCFPRFGGETGLSISSSWTTTSLGISSLAPLGPRRETTFSFAPFPQWTPGENLFAGFFLCPIRFFFPP